MNLIFYIQKKDKTKNNNQANNIYLILLHLYNLRNNY